MKTIPIYDATAPVVCTASAEEVPSRIDQIERMRLALDRIDRAEHGLVLHFPNDPAIEADVRSFAADEKACCQFWGFEVNTTADAIKLRWDGPPNVTEFLDRLYDYFRGTEPLNEISGLL